MPTHHKILHLLIIQLLQHKVLKPRIPQALRLITQPPRSCNGSHRRIIICKAMDIRYHLLPQCRIEHLINAIKESDNVPLLQLFMQFLLIQPTGNIPTMNKRNNILTFPRLLITGIGTQLQQQRQRMQRQIAHRSLRPNQRQILQQRGFSRTGIAQNDRIFRYPRNPRLCPFLRIAQHFKHTSNRLLHIALAMTL